MKRTSIVGVLLTAASLMAASYTRHPIVITKADPKGFEFDLSVVKRGELVDVAFAFPHRGELAVLHSVRLVVKDGTNRLLALPFSSPGNVTSAKQPEEWKTDGSFSIAHNLLEGAELVLVCGEVVRHAPADSNGYKMRRAGTDEWEAVEVVELHSDDDAPVYRVNLKSFLKEDSQPPSDDRGLQTAPHHIDQMNVLDRGGPIEVPLEQFLTLIVRLTDVELLYDTNEVTGVRVEVGVGENTWSNELSRVLSTCGFSYSLVHGNTNVYRVYKVKQEHP